MLKKFALIYSIGLNSKTKEKGRLCLFMGAPIKFDFFKLEKYFRPGAKFLTLRVLKGLFHVKIRRPGRNYETTSAAPHFKFIIEAAKFNRPKNHLIRPSTRVNIKTKLSGFLDH